MNTTASPQTTCPKCHGTGTITRFLDYKGGVCFDCGGSGHVAVARGHRRGLSALGKARIAAEQAIETREGVREALAQLEELQIGWGEAHYQLAHKLHDIINATI